MMPQCFKTEHQIQEERKKAEKTVTASSRRHKTRCKTAPKAEAGPERFPFVLLEVAPNLQPLGGGATAAPPPAT